MRSNLKTDDFLALINSPGRKLLIALNDLSEDVLADNTVYVVEVQEAAGVAGGRAAGMGLRKPVGIHGFRFKDGVITEFFETFNEEEISLFELPYHATAIDVLLPDGSQKVVSGVIDPDLVEAYQHVVQQIWSTSS
jgi:hypothetical protein